VSTLHAVLLVLHLIALAAVVVGLLRQIPAETKGVDALIAHGATTQLVTGLLLVGVLEADDADVNHVKIAVKLLVSLAVVGLAHANRRKPSIPTGLFWGLVGLELVNVVVALAW
jgi:uncharacterized membrane protein